MGPTAYSFFNLLAVPGGEHLDTSCQSSAGLVLEFITPRTLSRSFSSLGLNAAPARHLQRASNSRLGAAGGTARLQ